MARNPRRKPLRVKGLDVIVPLTRGGMGEVWLARRQGLHGFERLVAVKLIRSDLAADENIRNMFVDEARVLARLGHPAIAQVLDFGEKYGTLYLTMEYVPGLSLSRLMTRRPGPMEPAVAARMIADIARGLHAVHEQTDENGQPLNIVHRDVSPQNIMISFHGRMKLIDFGIALTEERMSEATSSGMVKGKIAYVAPEQITGVGADRRSDVYSLSIVLHELLTGQSLFEPRTNPIAAAKDRRSPPKPSRLIRVPRQLDRIVMKGLEMEPRRRWQDSWSMAVALEEFAGRAGGLSLEAYAERELAPDRDAHETWIQGLTTDTNASPPPTESDSEEYELEVSSSAIIGLVSERRSHPRPLMLLLGAGLALGAALTWASVSSGWVTRSWNSSWLTTSETSSTTVSQDTGITSSATVAEE